jgi:peptidoglycan hydrolase-like protein with peptidoglycan-binding domain
MTFDIRVFEAQEWVNAICYGVPGYNPAPEDGETGWSTMFAFTRALQHLLGITALSDTFGNGTLSALTSQFPVIGESTPTPGNPATTASKVVGIMQAALWCKGYWSAADFGVWNVDTGNSLESINSRIGLTASRNLTPKVFKSLLTMDAYVVVGSGTSANREVQQWLNSRYLSRADYYVIPTDGYYSRDVQRGLMFAIQYELGMADGTANGNFGPGTQSGLQTYGNFSVGAVDSTRKLIRLFQGALRFNGYGSTPFTGTYDTATSSQTATFQAFAQLAGSGSSNFGTWASLLVSTGDPNRAVTGSDTATPLTPGKAASMYSAGYRTVGRYLNVESKRYQAGEFATIFNAGLTTYPIYQEFNNVITAFDFDKGKTQGIAAVKRARQLGLNTGTVIYFAVDFDATGDDIVAAIIPFFQGVNEGVQTSKRVTYQVGVYGTRNVCARVSAAGLAVSSFIAGMSTGWSGNLGFPLPSNWSYDQIKTVTVGTSPNAIEIDKNVKRTGAPELGAGDVERIPMQFPPPHAPVYDELGYWRWALLQYAADKVRASAYVDVANMNNLMLMRLQKPTYWVAPGAELDESTTDALLRFFWTYLYTPAVWALVPPPPWDSYFEGSYNEFAVLLDGPEFGLPVSGPLGDLEHFAASTRGYIQNGVPSAGDEASLGDYGGWALDLVTLWNDYEAARLEAPGDVLEVGGWIEAKLGGTDGTKFDLPDLLADMAAFLVAKRIEADSTRSLSDIIRVIYNQVEDDPHYLANAFFDERFGSRADMVTAAKSVFTTVWPPSWAVRTIFSKRWPGSTAAEEGYSNPAQSVLDTELDDLAEGFALAIENAQG